MITEDGNQPSSSSGKQASISLDRWAIVVGAIALALTMIPYLLGYAFSGSRHFMWLGYNLDDSCVYLSWLRQAAEGSHRVLNMFTTEAQRGREADPLFLVLGVTARLFHLPLLFVLHASRIVFGGCLLAIVWRIIRRSTNSVSAQKLAFLFICFGSGLGWIPGLWPTPIDAWQPEAITFLSLYLSPLFCFSLALQALSVLYFVKAIHSGNAKYAVYAGLAVSLLGLTHTYDVVTMLAVFGAFAFVSPLLKLTTRAAQVCIFAAIVTVIAAPSVLYVYHELQTEKVFRLRMEVLTASGPLWHLYMGYGLLMAGAICGAVRIVQATIQDRNGAVRLANEELETRASQNDQASQESMRVMLVVWMVVNVAVSYLPVKVFPFQRKMLQGAHIPITILAGIGAAFLMEHVRALKSPWRFNTAAATIIFVLSLSNVMFVLRDIDSFENDLIQTTHMHRPYISQGEMEALRWIERNTPRGTAIQPLPWLATEGPHFRPVDVTLACFTPGLTNRPVYCGHWGETPDYPTKLSELDKFALPEPRMTDEARIALLRKMRVQYIVFSQKQPEDSQLGMDADKLMPMFRHNVPVPDYLQQVYSNADADVYKVNLP